MKRYLLTWYGTTDLRAALGLEESDGPVFSALKSGNYSDVIVLAYTNPSKDMKVEAVDVEASLDKVKKSFTNSSVPLDRNSVNRIVEEISNTPLGHRLFEEWIVAKLKDSNVEVRTQIVPSPLTQLNDTLGIHAAASHALRLALDDSDVKSITCHLSPGTPVMAYTWALISRSNPHLKIEIIASSNPNLPPEKIKIPPALLVPSFAERSISGTSSIKYDLVIHILGEQALPVLLGIRQFSGARHIIITSPNYSREADRLAAVTGASTSAVLVDDPFKPRDTRLVVAHLVEESGSHSRIAVNLTGGTKLMFAGALSACWELGLDPLYFEVGSHNLVFLRNGAATPFVGISKVDDFLTAAGYDVVSDGIWSRNLEKSNDLRLSAARQVWARRGAIGELYKNPDYHRVLNDWSWNYRPHRRELTHFKLEWKRGLAQLESSCDPQLKLDGQQIDVPRHKYFDFIAGHWLEDYLYLLLQPLVEEGLLRDLRVGLEVGYRNHPGSDPEVFAECDCVFTDGKRLWIVECKAGQVKQEAIQKLENNVRQYGGISGRGLLISSTTIRGTHKSRLERSTSLGTIPPDRLSTESLREFILAT